MISKILSFQLLCLALVHASPVSTTHAPVETTAAPVETSAAPVETSAAPVETTAAPVKAPVETSAAPIETSAAPVETSAAPVETTAAPVETTAAPVETSAAPVETTHAPVEATAAPVEATAAPVEATHAPVQTTHSYSTDAARDVAAAFPRFQFGNLAARSHSFPEDHSGESGDGIDEVDDTVSDRFITDISFIRHSEEYEDEEYDATRDNCGVIPQDATQPSFRQ